MAVRTFEENMALVPTTESFGPESLYDHADDIENSRDSAIEALAYVAAESAAAERERLMEVVCGWCGEAPCKPVMRGAKPFAGCNRDLRERRYTRAERFRLHPEEAGR